MQTRQFATIHGCVVVVARVDTLACPSVVQLSRSCAEETARSQAPGPKPTSDVATYETIDHPKTSEERPLPAFAQPIVGF